jgi:electron-transferring-flavoprotein dehydrogenase
MTERRAQRIPAPPTMHNAGFHTASVCEIVRWLGERAEALGVNLFAGFPVDALLVDGNAVRGVRTTPSGLGRDGQPTGSYAEPTDLTARVTVVAEGTRGLLAQAWREWQQVGSENPQLFALGVKELWEVKRPLEAVIHTLGWPLPADAFGGSFMYPLGPTQVALGLVVGLDYHDANLDVHELLQRMKLHPLFRRQLEGGQLLEWGAKTIPEGGYYALPSRRSGDGVLFAGDTVGFVDVPSLKGSTTRCSRGCTRCAPPSPRSRPATSPRRSCRPTTGWWTRATSWPTCAAPGTCGSRSRTGSTSAGSRRG